MRFLVILAAAALLLIVAAFYFGSGKVDLVSATPAPPPPAPKLDFTALGALLQKDMSNIPALLGAPRATPANAFNVRSRLQNAPVVHPEYQTLGHVCELIIDADKEHSVRQAQDEQTAGPDAAALHARAQADWDAYRAQTDAEVHRLLASLQKTGP